MSENRKAPDILIVDDEEDILRLVQGILQDEGYRTRTASSSAGAYAALRDYVPDMIILDIWLQGSEHDGMKILENVKTDHPYLPVIMISGHGTVETAVSAIKKGAYDFIEKPFKADRLLMMARRGLEAACLRRENELLRGGAVIPERLDGRSPAIQAAQQALDRAIAAPDHKPVLLSGEAGSGKSYAASLLHYASGRKSGPLRTLNCLRLPSEGFETVLFGAKDQEGRPAKGLFELAAGGTLVLDEVSALPADIQAKVARILQERRFHRGNQGGADGEILPLEARIVGTTCALSADTSVTGHGGIRPDLHDRLTGLHIHMPPLREREQDIAEFVALFMRLEAGRSAVPLRSFSAGALKNLQNRAWPGNLRQLHNVIEWIGIVHRDLPADVPCGVEHLPSDPRFSHRGGEADDLLETGSAGLSADIFADMPLREAREAFERTYLLAQLERFGGNVSQTAKFVGMERSALHRKLKALEESALVLEEREEGRPSLRRRA